MTTFSTIAFSRVLSMIFFSAPFREDYKANRIYFTSCTYSTALLIMAESKLKEIQHIKVSRLRHLIKTIFVTRCLSAFYFPFRY